ncbi:transposase [Streptomyces sp. NPDC086519]|uniref:IS701 family transposase n=1 Tax=Streptomyces sp. NPDC086519 TaxID=3154863 RepID=UPI00341F3E80
MLLRVGRRFGRVDLRRRTRDYVRGLLGPVDRKNGWQLGEHVGHDVPAGLQHLLHRSRWDPDEVRDGPQEYVAERLGEPDGVLIIDETGFLEKGTASAGLQRQYSGTAGRTENCQVAVFAACASSRGRPAAALLTLTRPRTTWPLRQAAPASQSCCGRRLPLGKRHADAPEGGGLAGKVLPPAHDVYCLACAGVSGGRRGTVFSRRISRRWTGPIGTDSEVPCRLALMEASNLPIIKGQPTPLGIRSRPSRSSRAGSGIRWRRTP